MDVSRLWKGRKKEEEKEGGGKNLVSSTAASVLDVGPRDLNNRTNLAQNNTKDVVFKVVLQ
jgi:hypothetical protein